MNFFRIFRDWPFILVLVIALWLELAFGLSGLVFATSVLAFSWSGGGNERVVFNVCFVLIAVLADLVFGRVLGQTALTIGLALMCWRWVQNLSRWRFFAYLGLGIACAYLLPPQPNFGVVITTLVCGWILMRAIHMQRGDYEIHIR